MWLHKERGIAMYCKNCGKEIEPDAKFCQECGTPVQEPAQPQAGPEIIPEEKPKKGKKPFYKRWWFWAIVVILVLGSCGQANTKPSKDAESTAKTAAAVTTEPAEITAAAATSSSEEIDNAVTMIESILRAHYTNYTISHEDNIITISIWQDGIAMGALLASQGNEQCKSAWDEMVENIKGLCTSVCEFVDTLGLDDVYVVVNILNDGNTENVLLTVMEGAVIYDSVNGD